MNPMDVQNFLNTHGVAERNMAWVLTHAANPAYLNRLKLA